MVIGAKGQGQKLRPVTVDIVSKDKIGFAYASDSLGTMLDMESAYKVRTKLLCRGWKRAEVCQFRVIKSD